MSAILFSSSSSRTNSRPQNRATTSTVMSSAVGPNPPLVTIRSTPWSAMKRSCASMSAGRSPQMVMWASSTPNSRSRSAIQGPLRSWTRPVSTSVPVTTIPARALTGMSLGSASSGVELKHAISWESRALSPQSGVLAAVSASRVGRSRRCCRCCRGRRHCPRCRCCRRRCWCRRCRRAVAQAPRTRYAKCGDMDIAYQVFGEGPLRRRSPPRWRRRCFAPGPCPRSRLGRHGRRRRTIWLTNLLRPISAVRRRGAVRAGGVVGARPRRRRSSRSAQGHIRCRRDQHVRGHPRIRHHAAAAWLTVLDARCVRSGMRLRMNYRGVRHRSAWWRRRRARAHHDHVHRHRRLHPARCGARR